MQVRPQEQPAPDVVFRVLAVQVEVGCFEGSGVLRAGECAGVAIPGQRIDLIVGGCVLVELKAAARVDVAHEAKMISYLRTTGLRLGLLVNFNGTTIKQGLKRIVV